MIPIFAPFIIAILVVIIFGKEDRDTLKEHRNKIIK
jgi:hypothetical protein